MAKKFNDILVIIAGVLLAKFGVDIFLNPLWERKVFGYVYDLSGYHKPLGVFASLVGVLMVWSGYKAFRKNKGTE